MPPSKIRLLVCELLSGPVWTGRVAMLQNGLRGGARYESHGHVSPRAFSPTVNASVHVRHYDGFSRRSSPSLTMEVQLQHVGLWKERYRSPVSLIAHGAFFLAHDAFPLAQRRLPAWQAHFLR